MITRLRIGTRGSALALYQADLLQSKLKRKFPLIETELVKIKTKGDIFQQDKIASIGRGIFTKEIEDALLQKKIDLAVHSAKDLETTLPAGLAVGAVLEREDVRDCLITKNKVSLQDLRKNAKIGTSSMRRKAQLKKLRPDLQIEDLRGNVKTRILKVEEGKLDGIVMAVAGMNRLGLSALIGHYFDPSELLPQASQGAIAVEYRVQDHELTNILETINHPVTALQVTAEREVLKNINGGCQVPAGIYSRLQGEALYLEAAIYSLDGSRFVRKNYQGSSSRLKELAQSLADELLADGGQDLLDELKVKTG
ncbi:MAG: hydroxymethylbilane synthase [Candidatus Omnitrophica bacterium CG11_big_fil_rev_8_21_14_0_20_45_26]|uniref:Porphobilinogen deaminase n=1 Tax=Candidatus Abzuiibacterium crystallinum TaxID=1974748 RepID=A0A2H0LNK4_9BACT|nr:MAG: hydroxymethylbilane synthase [Candidatus Omnitrophica bacterium CG11_big_fil_rev_8_21_14_0_20_45_26]PIW63848.1 MAG: hydroxymethylbilane synthase [Candidatus Omnitrophica bacterium CG12_big_fil_rev_8_21_14_0_65_45_16]